MKIQYAIVEDVLVKVDKLIFLVDFVGLDKWQIYLISNIVLGPLLTWIVKKIYESPQVIVYIMYLDFIDKNGYTTSFHFGFGW